MNVTPLPTTLEQASEYAAKNGRIVAFAPYGQHIALTCKNHPSLRWNTKNIGYIGARSIFFNFDNNGRECDCSGNCLEVVIPDNWLDLIVPIPICHCQHCGAAIGEETQFSNPNCCHDCYTLLFDGRNNFQRLHQIETELTGGKGFATREQKIAAMDRLKSELAAKGQ